MSTLKSILKEELLIEAVKINDGKDVTDLIKNKKLGVKVLPDYYNDFNEINTVEQVGKYFQNFIDRANNLGLKNGIVFGVQLLANKVRPSSLGSAVEKDAIYEIIKNKDKPWAKKLDEWELVMSDPYYNSAKWHNLEKKLQEESKNHGKSSKGSGEVKDVRNIYNDGTWSLQIPTSFEGEKAIAYFGKKGEKQTPCHWCTRANKSWYDDYSKNSPLYVIRNWETGKSYQIAFNPDGVDFLDQDDEKGDDITKGDLDNIPDELLEKIKYNNKTLKDYKHNFKHRLIVKKGQIKNPTDDINRAEWGKETPVEGDIVKQVWTNYKITKNNKDPLELYMIKNKSNYEGEKHNGQWAVKYYNKNNPKKFLVIDRIKTSYGIKYYDDNKETNENMNYFMPIEKIARKDFGINKREERNDIKEKENHVGVKKMIDYEYKNIDIFMKHINNELQNLLKKYPNRRGTTIKIATPKTNSITGGFMPWKISARIVSEPGEYNLVFVDLLKNNGLKYTFDKDDEDYNKWNEYIKDYYNKDYNLFNKEVEQAVNIAIKKYAKQAVKDSYGIKKRLIAKSIYKNPNLSAKGDNAIRLRFEEYLD